MAIPNVQVNVNELSMSGRNVLVPFVPAVILKTKSGPIGTVERVDSLNDFIAKFGEADKTTPAAFALQKYLRAYQFAYVTRVANKEAAAEGKSTIGFNTEEEVDNTFVEVPAQNVNILNKDVSAMVSEDTKVLANGSVKGTFHQITGWEEFSSHPEEQDGYYFPFNLKVTGETLTIKKNGRTTKEVEFDPEIVLRVTQSDVFEILVDETSIVTLNFAMSAFEGTAEPIITETSIDLLEVKTKYATDTENGKTITLKYDINNQKIFIDFTNLLGRNVTTIKEDLDINTLVAAEYNEDGELIGGLEFILNKLVASANAITGLPVIIENKFTDKTTTDSVPTLEQFKENFIGYIEGGDSGNEVAVAEEDIYDLIDLYHYSDYPIDEMVIPEYNSYKVVNYAVEKGRQNYYRVIAKAEGETIDEIKVSAQYFTQDKRGFLDIYTNDVTYEDFVDEEGNAIACPVSIAVLNAYAYANSKNAWCSVAGVNRGTLPQINGLALKFGRAEMDELYENTIPINTINYISSIGYVVWGNKTSASEEETKLFDRINVSRLVNYLNRELIAVGWEFMFEPITLALFTEFKNAVDGICQIVADQDGLDDWVVICNSSNNTEESIARNELHAQVQVKPTEALEYVIIDLTATDTITVDVNEIREV